MEKKFSYKACLGNFDDSISAAVIISRAAAGRLNVKSRPWWATVLFTRLCTIGMSLLLILPKNRFALRAIEHWDFAAVASLVRTLIECYFAFFYLCIESVSDDEWSCRLNIFQLHDCMSRIRMFRDFDPTDKHLSDFQNQAEELRERLRNNQYFQCVPEKKRRKLLKGESAYSITRDELIERIGEDPYYFRAMYRFLSSQVHTFPMSFYRMVEQDRGRGLENRVERNYISLALEFVGPWIKDAIRKMINYFPETEELLDEKLHAAVFKDK